MGGGVSEALREVGSQERQEVEFTLHLEGKRCSTGRRGFPEERMGGECLEGGDGTAPIILKCGFYSYSGMVRPQVPKQMASKRHFISHKSQEEGYLCQEAEEGSPGAGEAGTRPRMTSGEAGSPNFAGFDL